ncbi:MAG: bifunctional phosphoribosylaminoimidazolecarboxamide formyltransferase/IMP cyclohydrolase [Firmicutes bacterium]|nr:bifunctional phosphoribosylaminoimidazolecarboxamide formyltransferase/IMP cyclohydrolase [Bacillota bacterium]
MRKRALISVSDKTGVVAFAKGLAKAGYEIISTGGTAKLLENEGLKVLAISDVTKFPECLDGRVKTLHPNIHAGLLSVRDNAGHMDFLKKHKLNTIDVVVVNLYPFKDTLIKEGAAEGVVGGAGLLSLSENAHNNIIENIDIGGPAMLRSSAKNYKYVAAVVDPKDYEMVLKELSEGVMGDETRLYLASKVFSHTAGYDSLVAQYMLKKQDIKYPKTLTLTYNLKEVLRYGENPHQSAAFYENVLETTGTLPAARQIHGKELSFNNINDTTGAIELLKEFSRPTVVAIKHANACGVSSADDIFTAFNNTYKADPVSIFGGIIAANRKICKRTAEKISEIFVEIVVAPSFESAALDILKKKKNIRLLVLDGIEQPLKAGQRVQNVYGGLLLQDNDIENYSQEDLQIVTKKKPTAKQLEDLEFAFKVVKHIKSNAIVFANNLTTVGIGIGQTNRIWATELAIKHSLPTSKGAVMASDAFFPFPDCVEAAAKAGIKAIIQPGGSQNDKLSIDKCDELGIAMVLTGKRHFRH